MMMRRDIESIATARGVLPRTIERDYLLDACLHEISRSGGDLVFKGGTALFKFHGLNRFSEERVSRNCGLLGIGVISGEVESHQRAVNMEFRLRGPLFDGRRESVSRVVLNLSLKETPLPPDRLVLRSAYQDIPECTLHVMSVEEMCAEKVRAVMTREKARDVYDLWFLLRKGVMMDAGLVRRKLRLYGKAFSTQSLMAAIDRKRARWGMDLGPLLIGNLPDFDEVVRQVTESIKRPA
jgi:predicted nucleotidyltransferase component of viral defense system